MKSRRKNGFNRKMSLFIVGLMLISGVPGNVLAEEINADNTAIVQPVSSAVNDNLNEFKTTEQLNLETSILPDSEVLASSTVAGDYEYSVIEGGVSITKYNGSGGDVTIPATLDEQPVLKIDIRAFANCTSLATVTIPAGVTSISFQAFSGCSNLTAITVPESVQTVGDQAFYQCTSLESINMPGVISVGVQAFYFCGGLSSISLPGATSIGDQAFSSCYGLPSISLPNANSIGDSAFSFCYNLTSVNLPSVTSIGEWVFSDCRFTSISLPSVISIGYYAFYNCSQLTSITLSETMTSIGYNAFNSCKKLDSITIPKGITTIASSTFANCESLANVTLPDGLTYIDYQAFDRCYALTTINLPNSLTNIGNSAFNYCVKLTSIDLPNSLQNIDNSAFANCISLTSIEIPQGATTIGYQAFYNCESLTAVTIPDSVTDIGGEVFKESPKVTIYGVTGSPAETYANNKSIPFIGSAFFTVSSFTAVKTSGQTVNTEILLTAAGADGTTPYEYKFYYQLGADTTTIQNWSATASATFKPAAAGLYTLWVDIKDKAGKTASRSISDFKVIPAATEDGFETAAIAGGVRITRYTGSGTEVAIPATLGGEKVLEIGDGAFSNCTSLATISLPEGLLRIGSWSFENCGSLNSISIPTSVTSIGEAAFLRCYNLNSIALPDGVSSIGNDVFLGTGITSLVIPAGMTSISSQLLGANNHYNSHEYNSLVSISLPKTITSIDATAFDNCQNLTAINVAADNPNFSSHDGLLFDKTGTTLHRCPMGLTSISLPAVLVAISNNAFVGCSQLTSLMIPESVTTIGENAFLNCGSLQKVNIPLAVKSISANTFSGCYSLNSVSIPTGVTSIGDGAFQGCGNLITITLPESVLSIGDSAFNNCSRLNTVNFSEGLTSIGNGAFSNCSRLGSISLPKSITAFGQGVFNNCSRLSSITLPDTITTIGNSDFANCLSLTTIVIPKGVTSIDYYAFGNCIKLSKVVIPDTVTNISTGIFVNSPLINIYGARGSAAETYAKDNQIPFIADFNVQSFTADKASGQIVNTEIRLTAIGADGTAPYQYQFYYTQGGDATIIQPASLANTAIFKPTSAGTYTLGVEIQDDSGKTVTKSIADYQVITAPAAPPAGPSGPPAPPPAPEPTPVTNIDDQQAIADIGKAQAGASVAVPVKNDEPVPTSILETARGKDVNVVFEFENYSWSINGKSIDELSGDVKSYDLSVKTIDDPALGELSGGDDVLQIEISHNGALPFVGQLTYQVDPALNGKTVYRYYYNEELKKLVYQDEAVVKDGKVSFSFEHASKYVITDTGTLAPPDIAISYQTHVQNIGWQGFVKNGETSGTFAQSLRLEGIEITAKGADNLGVQYKTHVENLGWQDFVSNGTASGTSGKSLRLEAIQINLTGTAAADYDIYYQVHAQNFGWLDWTKNGASAGTEGLGYRLEAIKIMVVPKDTAAPGKTEQAFVKK